jgi:hypothetical protein
LAEEIDQQLLLSPHSIFAAMRPESSQPLIGDQAGKQVVRYRRYCVVTTQPDIWALHRPLHLASGSPPKYHIPFATCAQRSETATARGQNGKSDRVSYRFTASDLLQEGEKSQVGADHDYDQIKPRFPFRKFVRRNGGRASHLPLDVIYAITGPLTAAALLCLELFDVFQHGHDAHVAEIALLAGLTENGTPHGHLTSAVFDDVVAAFDGGLPGECGTLATVLARKLRDVAGLLLQCRGGGTIALAGDAVTDRNIPGRVDALANGSCAPAIP